VEKSRFGYLPLQLASRYGMIRLIDSRITYELLQREFVIPTRMRAISKHHEQIRTLEDIVDMDKAGMIVSPEVGLHENVAVLDFNDEYANLVLRHDISYETLTNNHDTHRSSTDNQMGLLPEIMNEIVTRRIHFKKQLKEKLEPNSLFYNHCEIRLEVLKQILVCLYGTSGSIWNRYSNVRVFEEINKLSRQILLKTKDIVQSSGFELIYADTDAVFLKRKGATKTDYENIMNELIRETGLNMTLEYHYKFLVLLYIEADEKMEARKHYYGLAYDNQLITRGIDTRRHDSPTFLKEFQTTLLSKLFDCNSSEEVLTNGYQNALLYITHSIDKLMNGEIQITDLVISKLLRQNIEKYRSLFPHVAAAIRLHVSGVIASRGDNIQYVYTNSNHSDPLQRIVPAKLISSENYDREKYLEMLLDSAEAVLSVFGFNRSLYGFDRKKTYQWWNEIYQQHERDIESSKSEL
jgi:DNA polymerase elongation subunit (family B)